MKKVRYVVTEHKGYFSQNDAYDMKDVYAIVSGLLRDAKEEGRTQLNITIDIK
ncbi:hypothetical protein [Paenibacillus sp. FSL P2-0173]|uniref:hypothetical protein n=1 Tax=Paenibacillus sp. FSL P2-0173 TaxID=2921627 RepID=UPI0030F5B251